VQLSALDHDRLPKLAGHVVLDASCLRHVNTLADDRPSSDLMGRAERNRTKPRLACLEAGDHGIAVAHGVESAAVHV
jgi:hypothetical protein